MVFHPVPCGVLRVACCKVGFGVQAILWLSAKNANFPPRSKSRGFLVGSLWPVVRFRASLVARSTPLVRNFVVPG